MGTLGEASSLWTWLVLFWKHWSLKCVNNTNIRGSSISARYNPATLWGLFKVHMGKMWRDRMCLLHEHLCVAGDKMQADRTWVGSLTMATHLLVRAAMRLEMTPKEAVLPIATFRQLDSASDWQWTSHFHLHPVTQLISDQNKAGVTSNCWLLGDIWKWVIGFRMT